MLSRTEVENQIKALSEVSWLLPSQMAMFQELRPFLGGLHRVINLYGPHGTGKTFLARIIHKEALADYICAPEQLRPSPKPLIVDNASPDRMAVRSIRNHMRLHSISQLVLVTASRAEDSIPAFELSITQEDIAYFRSNLFRPPLWRTPLSRQFWGESLLVS